jgi:hypothetical protein
MKLARALITAFILATALNVPAKDEIDASVSPRQMLRGGAAQELRIYGSSLALTGVEITPPEGITIGEWKVRDPIPEDQLFRPAGVKVWTMPVTIDAAAAPGERKVVAVTAKGRSAAMPLKVVTHAPAISELNVVSVTPAATQFTVLASDEENDLGGEKVIVLGDYYCGNRFSVTRVEVTQAVAKDKTLEIHGTAPSPTPAAVGTCEFGVTVYDTGHISSNRLAKVVVYR